MDKKNGVKKNTLNIAGPSSNNKHRLSTKIVDDIFTDEVVEVKTRFHVDYTAYLERLWQANPEIYNLLKKSASLEAAREFMYSYLDRTERKVFDLSNDLHILEKATVRESIHVFKSIIGPINEARTGVSALYYLWKLSHGKIRELKTDVSVGFLLEFINLFRGVAGKSHIYLEAGEVKKGIPDFLRKKGREAAEARTEILDELGSTLRKYFKKYPSGMEDDIISWRKENRSKILKYFKGAQKDWDDYRWHLKNVIRTERPLFDLIELTSEEKESVKKAVACNIPFGITPYYLSLMDSKLSLGYDHTIRAQVIPTKNYIDIMSRRRINRNILFDFMGENDTTVTDLVARRYPLIAIFKPFNTCAQICVYCQRNWEIKGVLDAGALSSKRKMETALSWFDEHPSIGDILITGGDPLVMKDSRIKWIMENLSAKKHIFRIRLGTRTPVVLPMRWTDQLVRIISRYHQPPNREISIVTHFEHSYEITPDAMEAVQKIRKRGINVYNQLVYTIENSRRFETAKMRRDLKSIGVEPYYTFNMKGKEETSHYMVPIARILQERKEEARLLPGLDRTDEPVFNVPRLGKNHLRALQDHRLVMIQPDGSRVYELHPWEKNIAPIPPYNYVDVPIYNYLEELAGRGENIRDYRTIWFYY